MEVHHSKNEPKFSMKMTGKFKKLLNRQINEAMRILEADPNSLLNSKKEYCGPAIKRRVIEKTKYKCIECKNIYNEKN